MTVKRLADVKFTSIPWMPTRIPAIDKILGGGLVKGAAILLAGSPGAGKSTVALQIAGALARQGSEVLFVAGEEPEERIRTKATQLDVLHGNIFVTEDVECEQISADARGMKILIVDSIQKVWSRHFSRYRAGSVTQLVTSISKIIDITRDQQLATVIIGHVTKNGWTAGPRSLPHLADVGMKLECEDSGLRVLKCYKNRFGTCENKIVFGMTDKGLRTVEEIEAEKRALEEEQGQNSIVIDIANPR